MYKKILLPTDGSTYANSEVDRATKLLADDGEVIVLSVAGKITSSAFQSRTRVRNINKRLLKEAENNVKVMVENYGYEVLDLGKDVPPETIVETAIAENIRVVGLSALMTTTVVSMEDTIRLLREKKPDTQVVVGGAVMTQEYADNIGADCYAKDAMATVRFCDEVFTEN